MGTIVPKMRGKRAVDRCRLRRNDLTTVATGLPSTLPRAAGSRWLASYATFAMPQAAVPISFALIAFPATGDAQDGALLVLAMTLAQIVGAVPVARWGSRWNAVRFLHVLVALRTAGLIAVAVLARFGVDFVWLSLAAAAAGFVNGAAYGYLRATLNHLIPADRMPRMLSAAATLNEVTFVAMPVLAATLGSFSVTAAVVAPAVLGAASLLLMPRVPGASAPAASATRSAPSGQAVLWLACVVATSSAVAAIEVGAVAIAVGFGMPTVWGAIFAVALCAAAVASGIAVGVCNWRMRTGWTAVALVVTAIGAVLAAVNIAVWVTLLGAVMIGAFLTPLATHYSLIFDEITPPDRRAEVFALYRTSVAVGIIIASAMTAFFSTAAALVLSAIAILLMLLVISVARRRPSWGTDRRG